MKRLLITASLAASAILPSAAQAQAVPAAVVAVVDLERVSNECTACKTAGAALRAQVQDFENRRNALAGPLQTEQKSIQAAVDVLKGKQPDAALQARIRAFQTKSQQAEEELATQQDQFKRNNAYIQKQIADKLGPIYTQVMQKRGANIMVNIDATLASGSALDVTNDVLAALNAALPSVQTTAPAAARQSQPQGR